ncbi:unnamed protein product [Clonostachys solani]|uniref:Uncharacterized protein n=1 Tax=Clonostachys solani TaxID=160281 RepID=A0A9N9Z8W9_9HYPO|nr:unnamed protein product [Clonostachys solani]
MSQPAPVRRSNPQQQGATTYTTTYPVSNAATQGSSRDATGFGTQSSQYHYQHQHIPPNGNFDVSFAGSQFTQ